MPNISRKNGPTNITVVTFIDKIRPVAGGGSLKRSVAIFFERTNKMKKILGLGLIAMVGALVSCSTTDNTNTRNMNANNAYVVNATPASRTPDPGVTPPMNSNYNTNSNAGTHMNSNMNTNHNMNSNKNHN